MKTLKIALSLLTGVALLVGCTSDADRWHVSGHVEKGNEATLYLESVNNGVWASIDSVALKESGQFSFAQPRREHPDLYRLRIGSQTVVFPIDSTETVTIEWAGRPVIGGSSNAELMQKVNDLVGSKIEADSLMTREVAKLIKDDWGSIVAYYAINLSTPMGPVFDPSKYFDRGIIGAVANAFVTNHPDDPRTEMLRRTAIANQRNYNPGASATYYASEVNFPEIALLDNKGETKSLTDTWKGSKVVILNFTDYSSSASPAVNILLSEVYNEYKDRGLEIYQVGNDADEFAWRDAALNLPWVTVYNAQAGRGKVLAEYNVGYLPLTFVMSGERMVRVDDMQTLKQTVASML